MGTEDFTFPTHNFLSSSIDSPPLWRSSPAATSTDDICSCHEQEEMVVKDHHHHHHQISRDKMGILEKDHIESSSTDDIHEDDEDQMIKMDMLWEDFNNEELLSTTSTSAGDDDDNDQMLQLGCVQALKLSNTNRNKSPGGVVVFIKVFKRLFFLHSSRHKLKKPAQSAWSSSSTN